MNTHDLLHRLAERLRHAGAQATAAPNSAMLELFRPNLGDTPPQLRRVIEPLVATCAMVVLAALLAVGAASFTLFLLAGALIYAIVTQVFGIEMGAQMPQTHL